MDKMMGWKMELRKMDNMLGWKMMGWKKGKKME